MATTKTGNVRVRPPAWRGRGMIGPAFSVRLDVHGVIRRHPPFTFPTYLDFDNTGENTLDFDNTGENTLDFDNTGENTLDFDTEVVQ